MPGNFPGIGTSSADDKLIQLFKLYSAVGILWVVICILICFLQLFHHMALPFAATFWLILIYTEVLSDIVFVNQVVNDRKYRNNYICGQNNQQKTRNYSGFHGKYCTTNLHRRIHYFRGTTL